MRAELIVSFVALGLGIGGHPAVGGRCLKRLSHLDTSQRHPEVVLFLAIWVPASRNARPRAYR